MSIHTSGEKNEHIARRIIGAMLLICLSAVFFYSAYSKIYTPNAFDNFQWTFLDLGISSILVTGILARLMIGLELLLGLFLLGHIFLRRFTYKAVIILLLVFIVYLLLVLLKQGNTGNCGCFGDKLAMKPLTAIWKNLAMIVVTAVLIYIYPSKSYKHQEWMGLALGFIAISAPFIFAPLYTGTAPKVAGRPINLAPLYNTAPSPEVDLRTGKHIVAFMSLTCPHCKKAAYLLQIIHRDHPALPIYLIIDGSEDFKKQFFDETHAESVPHLLYLHHTNEFEEMVKAGLDKGEISGVPAIYWINNSVIEYRSPYAYYQLDPGYMEKWMRDTSRILKPLD